MNYLFSVKTHKTLYFKCWWNTNEKWSYIGPQTHQKKTLNKLQNVELVHKTLSDPNTKKLERNHTSENKCSFHLKNKLSLKLFKEGILITFEDYKVNNDSGTYWIDSLLTKPPGKPMNTGVGNLSLIQRTIRPRNWTRVSCIAGRFFTSWATREAHWIDSFKEIYKLTFLELQHQQNIHFS